METYCSNLSTFNQGENLKNLSLSKFTKPPSSFDFALEGPSVVRTASIINDQPQELAKALMGRLHRGVSIWEITGGYTGQKRSMVFCTVNRAQISELKQIVSDVNPDAFVVIGNAQQALGIGFKHVKRRKTI